MRRMVGKRDRISRLIWDYGATERRYTFRDSSRPKYFWRGAGKPTARFIPTILTKNFIHDPFFQRSSCHQSISCFSNNTLESRYNHLKFHWVYDRWSPFQEIRNVAFFFPLLFFFLFEKRRRKEGGEKKEWPRFDIRFFFHREETFQFKFNFGPDPLKIPRFWDTNLCSPPRSMKQKKRKKEASRNRTHSPFLYSAWYYEFCFSLLAGNVTFQRDEIHGLIQETLLLVLLECR